MNENDNLLAPLQRSGHERLYPGKPRITVGMATCGRAAGGAAVLDALERKVREDDLGVDVVAVGCRGMCWGEPLVEVWLPGQARAVYGHVDPEQAVSLLEAAVVGVLPERGLLGRMYSDRCPAPGGSAVLAEGSDDDLAAHPFLAFQERRILCRSGLIQPWSAEEYVATGGYSALGHALMRLAPEDVIEAVEDSGLRGRGGAGFPTGRKWRITYDAESPVKYVVANADEGDPGAFMDRGLLESDPHAVLEGLALAGYAVGATQGYVFTRSEYPLAIETLERAIADAKANGLLGEHVLGTDWNFSVGLVRSAGAYVCGEESAMLRAMEGYPGRPKRRPPYPSERGLWGAPTCINNVETLATVPPVILRGADWFRECGTPESPGTKIFSVAGAIELPGLVELPLGSSLQSLCEHVGGESAGNIKAVQVGGPSGVILPRILDVALDYEGLTSVGGAMGSGGIVVLGEDSCVVDTTRYFLSFSVQESCGQCSACRDGLAECLAILTKVSEGEAKTEDLEELKSLLSQIVEGSLCGLGKMATRPLASSLRYFPDEYEAHLAGRCPGLVCRSLIRFEIDEPKCPGCRCCVPTCPTNAMQGRFGKPYTIVERLCSRCRMCISACPYDAVKINGGG